MNRGLAILFFAGACLFANDILGQREVVLTQLKTLLEREWQGVTPSEMTNINPDIKSVFQRLYDLKFDMLNYYTGQQVTVLSYKSGRQSWARCKIYGKLHYKEKSGRVWISYNEANDVIADSASISKFHIWCPESGELDIYEDESKPGQYFLKGELNCPQLPKRKVEFSYQPAQSRK